MGLITGITGMSGGPGDGLGGQLALSIERQIERFLYEDKLSWQFATRSTSVKAGSVWYDIPLTLQVQDYANGRATPQAPQIGEREVKVNNRQTVLWTYELFNVERYKNSDQAIATIAATMSIAMLNAINASYLENLKWHTLGTSTIQKNSTNDMVKAAPAPQCEGQWMTVSAMGIQSATAATTGDAVFNDIQNIIERITLIGQTYDLEMLGVNKAEFVSVISPLSQVTLSRIGRNQPAGTVGEFQIGKVTGMSITGFYFITENMLDKNIAAGTSFNKDFAINLSGVVGFAMHREAVALPINLEKFWMKEDHYNGNPIIGLKYQFGFGIIRPSLIFAIVKENAIINFNSYFITGTNETLTNNIENATSKYGTSEFTNNTTQVPTFARENTTVVTNARVKKVQPIQGIDLSDNDLSKE